MCIPSLPYNITNLICFDDDEHITHFLTNKQTFKDITINDEEHIFFEKCEHDFDNIKMNILPNAMVILENLFDLQEKFKRPFNVKFVVQP